ncbi:MAG: MFS transporter [Proteobacteria bacterium]|nr:MFS transporter [Pseudomonadota bacterium]
MAFKGGIQAVVGGAAAVFWPGSLVFGFTGVMGPQWARILGVGPGAIGACLFFVLAGAGVMMFVVGKLQVRLGIRRMITTGILLCGLATLLVAWPVRGLWQVYAWAFGVGLGSSFGYLPALTTVQMWHPARRGVVSGIVNTMFGGAAAVVAPLLALGLEGLGYLGTNLVMVGCVLVGGLAAAVWCAPPGEDYLPAPPATAAAALPGPSLTATQAVRTSAFWFLWGVWAMMGAAGIAMVTLAGQFGRTFPEQVAAGVVILTAFNLTNGLSRILTGYLSDLVGRRPTMCLAFTAAGLAYLIMPHGGSLTAAAVLAAVVGFGFGTLFAVSAPLASDVFGLRHFGAIFGLVFTAYGFLAGALGPWLSGYLLAAGPGGQGTQFGLVFSYLGVFCLVSAGLIPFVRRHPQPNQ